MKKFKKIIIISFLWLFVVTIFGIVAVEAQQEIIFKPQVPIDGFGERRFGETGSTQYIAEYISAIYRYGISIGAILATVVLMAAGLIWLTSGGSQEKIGKAKNMISGSIIGLVLLFGSYTILNTINPELVDFYIQDIHLIPEITYGCCQYGEGGATKAKMTVSADCEERDNSYFFENRFTDPNELFAPNQGCYERDGGCCTVTVQYYTTGGSWNVDSKTTGLKFPVLNPKHCTTSRSTLVAGYRILSNYTNETCDYEKTNSCNGTPNGFKFYDASRQALTGPSVSCESEGVCGWCFNGTGVNTFAKKTNEPCGSAGSVGRCQDSCEEGQAEFESGRRCDDDMKCCSMLN